MQATTLKATSIPELESKIQQARLSFVPTIAIVFAHICFDLKKVSEIFTEEKILCMGASSGGEFVDGEFGETSIVALLMDLDISCFKIVFAEFHDKLKVVSKTIGEAGTSNFSKPAYILLASGLSNDGEVIINAIQEAAGLDAPIYGGFASENMKFTGTFVTGNGQTSENGIVCLILDTEKVSVSGMAAGGWKPVGITRTITKSEGNKVYTIDNEPALDLTARYMRVPVDTFRQGSGVMKDLATKFQLQVYRKDNYSVMRTPFQADVDERSMTYSGSMPEGSKIQFTILPSFDVIDNCINEFARLKEETAEPEAVIVFSCKARELIFGPMIAEEVERIRDLWQVPMAGFLSYGEIGNVNSGRSEFHAMMCSLVMIKEKL